MGVILPWARWDLAANTTLSESDLGIRHWVNCTSASNLTLPTAVEGAVIHIYNYGTQTITLKNPAATTIGTLNQNDGVTIYSYPDASGNPAWPLNITELGDYLNFASTPA